MNEFSLIAEIVSAGKDGFVKIITQAGYINLFEKDSIIFIDFWDQKKAFEIEDTISSKNSFFVKFKKFEGLRDISLLIGRNIFIQSFKLEGISSQSELLLEVYGYEVHQNGVLLGFVTDKFQMPANDVIVLRTHSGKEILIPYVLSIFEKIDKEKKVLILNSDYGIQDDED